MSTSVISSFFPIGPVSSALMRSTSAAATGDKPSPPAKGAFSSDSDMDKEKELAQSKSRQQASLSRLVDEFFWIGSSIVAFSKWRLGFMVEKCMTSMQTGTQMVKLRGGSKGLVRYFYLDEHKSCIRWRPSRKNEKAKISIDSIREVCEGKQSEIFQRYAEGSFDPNCCFSLYYGEHMESLDLVSSTGEEARTWITGLKYLVAGISDEDSLAKRQRTRDQWLKQTFTEADKNGDGSLSISEVLHLLHKLNVNLPRQKVKQMFKEADTDDNQGTLGFEEFCSFYKMMSTRRDLYLLMLTYSNHKDHLDADDLARFLETEQKMTKVTKDHCLEIINKFEPCSENQKQGVLGIDGFTNYMRSPEGDIFNPEHYEVNQDMSQPLCNYFIASSHNTYLMGDQLMSQSRVDMYAWVLQAGCRCVEVDCWDGQDGEPIVHHGYTLTSKILFKDVIETINKYAFVKNDYPVILSIENHCSVAQQKKMAQYLMEILGEKLDLSSIKAEESGCLPSPETLKGKILVKGKKLPPNIDENAEEGDVSDEDSADEMDDDCKLMNGDTTANRKQVENVAKKKLDNLMKESKIRDREDPDSFTIAALPSTGKPTDQAGLKGKGDDGTDTADEANPSNNKRASRSFMGTFAKHKKKTSKLKKTSSFEDTDTDQESTSSASRVPLHHSKKKKTMKLSRALSDLVKYTRSVGLQDIEAQDSCSWQVSSLSETKAHQLMQQKPNALIHFNQRQLSRIYPSSYRVDSSNFNPQPFWNAGSQLVALNYQSEGRVLQLNRAKFYSNGNCGYIIKPVLMCEGAFNPNLEDPLPGQMKKQLVLKIISGQQLPKPKDSMLGDRGEIIDPFVEVEIIGLPVDCCKEQTRVVDDNGFNPMWEETLVFTLHMPELALVRFLVWDHDPIGQDFIGQRTIAFSSMMPGYRHVYLEGMEEASIFVHVAVNDITGKWTPLCPNAAFRGQEFLGALNLPLVTQARAASGIKGLFHRNPKQASLDSHAAAQHSRKHPFGAHLLRRTASAPTKGQPKIKEGFPEIAIDTKDNSSEGVSDDRESEDRDKATAAASQVPTPPHHRNGDTLASRQAIGTWDHPDTNGAFHPKEGKGSAAAQRPASPPPPPPTVSEEPRDTSLIRSVSTPVDKPSSSRPPLLSSSAIMTESPSSVPSRRVVDSTVKVTTNSTKTLSLPISFPPTPLSLQGPASKTVPTRSTQDPWVSKGNPPSMVHIPSKMEACQTETDKWKNNTELNSDHKVELPGTPSPADPPLVPVTQRTHVRRALYGTPSQPTPVRRAKSEGHVRVATSTVKPDHSAVPEVCIDATVNDQLWRKLDPGSHRDSMSSSSSVSSSDTIIDLSLPNLVRMPTASSTSDPPWVSRHRSATVSFDHGWVSKSKSNPNLRQGELPEDELLSRPLGTPREASVESPKRLTQRRHTWSRLYMDGLKQSSAAASSANRPSVAATAPSAMASMSKSLGDLTSDDIACNFDSKYRSISRSFIVRPTKDQHRKDSPNKYGPKSDLTEQLRRLTDVEPLTASDFAPKAMHRESQAEVIDEPLLRRTSSRSQSRVRYIANRAKQALERQRLQGLIQSRNGSISISGSISSGSSASPIEERGNPEGACCVTRSPCASMDLLSQLNAPETPSPRPSQSFPDTDNNEVFFMLKL
ncbi:LOW QUALITY PROTEIN: 1-phosphatidylinositol 4,5-bisphosphate phosphodiesterase eta-2a [Lampris incognitus]|uniref:LOW QUALITY PROTEIN: 1-phosphatidylinositol 4,5-bisphosphate phosphodiesterase eta-2a n=1 Tax=Lampris incognitus TaxID=2546036 RepID=UPI0024B53C57|nr:LOW QUALITY PROTEIN: 1-phosphatidylinositol 4,5-bisphosphate phosphodiesterase eta-2a [Lampris incognitus]